MWPYGDDLPGYSAIKYTIYMKSCGFPINLEDDPANLEWRISLLSRSINSFPPLTNSVL